MPSHLHHPKIKNGLIFFTSKFDHPQWWHFEEKPAIQVATIGKIHQKAEGLFSHIFYIVIPVPSEEGSVHSSIVS